MRVVESGVEVLLKTLAKYEEPQERTLRWAGRDGPPEGTAISFVEGWFKHIKFENYECFLWVYKRDNDL